MTKPRKSKSKKEKSPPSDTLFPVVTEGEEGKDEGPPKTKTPPPKVHDVGMFIRDHLRDHGEDYVSQIHKAFKDAHRERKEGMRKNGIKGWRSGYRVATYHSFLTYCSKLVLIGLLEHSGRVEEYDHSSLGTINRVYVRLSSKGSTAPGYVWAKPLKLWYGPVTGEEKQKYPNYISETAVEVEKGEKVARVKEKEIKKVKPKPSIRPVVPRKKPKTTISPLVVAEPSSNKLLTKWSGVKEGAVSLLLLEEALNDVDTLTPYYNTKPCTHALKIFLETFQKVDPQGRHFAWVGFINCLRELAEQEEEGAPSIYTIVESLKAIPMDEEKKSKSLKKLEAEIGNLTTEQRGLIEGIEDVETAIEDYKDISREGMTPEEYAEEKEGAWEGVIEALDAIEVIEEEEEEEK